MYDRRRRLSVYPSRSAALVAMVQTASHRNGDDPSNFRQLDQARLGRVLLQSEVRPASMIIGDWGRELLRKTTRPRRTVPSTNGHTNQCRRAFGSSGRTRTYKPLVNSPGIPQPDAACLARLNW